MCLLLYHCSGDCRLHHGYGILFVIIKGVLYRALLGGLVVLLGLVNGLSGLPRFFISVQDFLGCIRVAEFCSV